MALHAKLLCIMALSVCMASGGTLVSTTSPPDEVLAKVHKVAASFVFHQSDASRLEEIVESLDAGKLRVLVDRTVPLQDFTEAFA